MNVLRERKIMLFEVADSFKKNWGGEPGFDDLMQLDGEMYRQVARRKTFKFSLQGKDYFAKIHNGVGWIEIIKNLLQARLPVLGASNEYQAIKALTRLDIKTMALAAFGQRGNNPAERASFVITESLEPAISLEDLCVNWANETPSLALKRGLIEQVASISRQLHQHGINHRDLYICHFLLKENDLKTSADVSELPLYLIDLHRVQLRSKTPQRWRVKDLAALYFSSMDIGFSQRDFYRFIRIYSGTDLRTALSRDKRLWQKVATKAMALKAKPLKG